MCGNVCNIYVPDEIALCVLQRLGCADLLRAAVVSREWRRLARDPILWRQMVVRECLYGVRCRRAEHVLRHLWSLYDHKGDWTTAYRRLYSGSTLFTWGSGQFGRTGHGDQDRREVPVEVSSMIEVPIVGVTCGEGRMVVWDVKGRVYGSGRNGSGQLGFGDTIDRHHPVQVLTLKGDIIQVRCGEWHTVFLDSTGVVWGAGSNDWGQLGIGPDRRKHREPVVVEGLRDHHITKICAGVLFSCAVSSKNSFFFWGDHCLGLGMGTSEDSEPIVYPLEVEIPSSARISQISCRGRAVLLLMDDETVFAMGEAKNGVLGVGVVDGRCMPMEVKSLRDLRVVHLGGGLSHSLAVTADGGLFWWGTTRVRRACALWVHQGTPRRMDAFSGMNVQMVSDSAFGHHSLVLCEGGKLFSFGMNERGQLGAGRSARNEFYTEPQTVLVPEFSSNRIVASVMTGGRFSALLLLR